MRTQHISSCNSQGLDVWIPFEIIVSKTESKSVILVCGNSGIYPSVDPINENNVVSFTESHSTSSSGVHASMISMLLQRQGNRPWAQYTPWSKVWSFCLRSDVSSRSCSHDTSVY